MLPDAEEPLGLFFSNHLGFKALFEAAGTEVEAVEHHGASTREAADRILELVGSAEFAPPAFRLDNADRRYIDPGRPLTALPSLWWLAAAAPPDVRRLARQALWG